MAWWNWTSGMVAPLLSRQLQVLKARARSLERAQADAGIAVAEPSVEDRGAAHGGGDPVLAHHDHRAGTEAAVDHAHQPQIVLRPDLFPRGAYVVLFASTHAIQTSYGSRPLKRGSARIA